MANYGEQQDNQKSGDVSDYLKNHLYEVPDWLKD